MIISFKKPNGSDSPSVKVEESKSVEITGNGLTDVQPSEGFDAMKAVKVNTNVPQKIPLGGLKFGNANLDHFTPDYFDATGDNAPTDLTYMFGSATKTTPASLSLSSWDLSKATTVQNMFRSADIQSIDLSNKSLANAITVTNMFSSCKAVSIDLRNLLFNESITDLSNLFRNCTNLKTLNLSPYMMPYTVQNVSYMFYNCSSITTLNLSVWSFDNVLNIQNCFYNCHSLVSLNISNWNMAYIDSEGISGAFSDCTALENLSISTMPDYNVNFKNLGFDTCTALTRESLVNILNALPTTTQTGATITVGSANIAKLTEQDKAIATAKNWAIA